jgi:DNA invertase Pin-like site-specific DNA recombinase
MPLIGYARVSTEDQATDAQVDVLKAAGCAEIFREHMSGAKASRPELAKALARVRRGDVLVVSRLDRLARSLSHLLSVIAELDAKGAHFKSLADPIDTTTPQGRFALQVLGAVAELERALIQERTKDGLRAAKRRGRVGGNPKLRAGDRDAIKQIVDAKAQAYFERVNRTAEHWLPIVKDMRPDHRWQDVVRVLNAKRDRSNAGESGEGKSCRDEACEEFVVPGGGFAPHALRVLSGRLADQILRPVFYRREVGRRIFGAHPAVVVAKHHVHDPMQAVLHRPMIADHRSDQIGQQRRRGDVKPRFLRDLAVDFACALDHDEAFQSWPVM